MADDREEHLEQGAAPRPRASRSQQHRGQRSVFQYITILFAAALVLLFFTFMMERRQFEQLEQENQENIDNLQQSVSAVQRLEGLIAENEQLKGQLEEQARQLEELQARYDRLETDYNTAEQANISQSRTAEALDWFWQIDEAYVRGKYGLCRSLIEDMGEALAAYLPDYSVTDNGRFSPADRYQEIREKVVK